MSTTDYRLDILYKKYVLGVQDAFINDLYTNETGAGLIKPSIYPSLQIYNQPIPNNAPTDLTPLSNINNYTTGTGQSNGSTISTGKQTSISNPHIAYYQNIKLTDATNKSSRKVTYVYNIDQPSLNILRNAIPSMYGSGYGITVYDSVGATLANTSILVPWTFDPDSGILLFPNTLQNGPPSISFWRYEGTMGLNNIFGDVSLNNRLTVVSDTSLNQRLFVGADVSMNTRLFVGGDVSFNSRLFVLSDTSLNSRLFVGGDVSLNQRLTVYSDTSLNSRLFVGGDVSLNQRLTVYSDTSLNSRLFVGGDVSLNQRLTVYSDTSLNQRLFVGADVSMNTRLFVGGDVSLNARLFVLSDTSLNSRLFVGGDVSLNQRLTVYSDTSLNKRLFVGADVSMNTLLFVGGDVSLNSRLFVLSDTSLNSRLFVGGDVSLNNRLFVLSDTSLNSRLFVGGDVSLNNRLFVLSDTSLNSRLFVGGDVSLNNRLFVLSDTSLNKRLFVGADVSMNTLLFVGGDVSLNSRLFVLSDTSLNSRLFVGGDVSLNNRLFVLSDTSLNQRLFVGADVSMNALLFVGGDVSLNNRLFVLSDTSLNSRLFVGGDVSFNNRLFVLSDTSLNQRLFVGADVSMNTRLFVGGDVSFNNRLFVLSDTSLNSRLFVGGDVSFNNRLFVLSDTSLNQRLFVGADVSMNTRLFVGGDVSLNSRLFVLSDTSLNSSLFVGGDVSFNNRLFVLSDTSLNQRLFVGADVSMNTRLFVGGDVSLNSRLFVLSDTSLNSRLFVGGDVSFNNRLFVLSDTSLNKRLFVGADVSMNTLLFVGGDVSLNARLFVLSDTSLNQRLFVGGDVSLNNRLFVLSDTSLNKRLFVGADVSMNTLLFVGGDVSFNNRLFVLSDTSLNQRLFVGADVSMNTRLFVGGDVSFNNHLFVLSDTSLNQRLFVGADVSMNTRLFVGGDVSLNNRLFVLSDTSLNQRLFVGADVSMNTRLFVGGDVSLNNRLFVLSDTSLNSRLFVGGDVSLNNRLFVLSDTSLNQRLFVGADVSMNTRLFVGGDVSLNNRLFVLSDTSLNQRLFVGADVSMNTRLFVGGDVSLNARLFVLSDTSLNQRLFVGGDVSLNQRLTVYSDTSLNQRLFVGGDVSLNSRLNVGGDINVIGNINITAGNVYINSVKIGTSTTSTTNDVWTNNNLIGSPPPIVFGAPQYSSTSIFIPWTYPSQMNVGFINSWVPVINSFSCMVSGNISGTGSINLTGNVLILGNVSGNGNINQNYSSNNPSYITGIVLSKDTTVTSGYYSSFSKFGFSPTANVYAYSNTNFVNLVSDTTNNLVTAWYSNYNTTINKSSVSFNTFLAGGVPSTPGQPAINGTFIIQTQSTGNIGYLITVPLKWTSASIPDYSAPLSTVTIINYDISYSSLGSSVRYGGPIADTGGTVIVGNVLTCNVYNLYPDSLYLFRASAVNSGNPLTGNVSIYGNIYTANLNTAVGFTSLTNSSFSGGYTVMRASDGTLMSGNIYLLGSAITSTPIISPINALSTRGIFGQTGNLLTLTATLTNNTLTNTVIGNYKGFPLTTPSTVTSTYITITPSTNTDSYVSGNTATTGFYSQASSTIQINPIPSSGNITTLTLVQQQYGNIAGTGLGNGAPLSGNVSTSSYLFGYDTIPNTAPTISSATIQLYNNILYKNVYPVSGVYVMGSSSSVGANLIANTTVTNNLGNFYHNSSQILSYTHNYGSKTGVVITNETRIPSGNIVNTKISYPVYFSNSSLNFINTTYGNTISVNMNAYNPYNASTTLLSGNIAAIMDYQSINMVYSTLPQSIPTITTSGTIGCRVSSGNIASSGLYIPTYLYPNNNGSNTYTSLSPLYGNTVSLCGNAVINNYFYDGTQELMIANGLITSYSSTYMIDYSSYLTGINGISNPNYSNYLSTTVNGYRYATFCWKIPASINATNIIVTLNNLLYNGAASANLSQTTGLLCADGIGGLYKILLYFRLEDSQTPKPTNSSTISTYWISMNDTSTTATSIAGTTYFQAPPNGNGPCCTTNTYSNLATSSPSISTVSPITLSSGFTGIQNGNGYIYVRIGLPILSIPITLSSVLLSYSYSA